MSDPIWTDECCRAGGGGIGQRGATNQLREFSCQAVRISMFSKVLFNKGELAYCGAPNAMPLAPPHVSYSERDHDHYYNKESPPARRQRPPTNGIGDVYVA